jgi:hypothetical protein
MNNLQIFQGYRNLGYQIIPLHFGRKSPVLNNWNRKYDHELIETYFRNSDAKVNFGILLGDIVDVEGDSIQANQQLSDLFSKITHPIYQSAKSLHHLFRNPHTKLTRVACEGIELRAYRHQSAIPPSTHKDGMRYKWLTKLMHVDDIPVLPEFVNDFLNKIRISAIKKKYKNKVKPGHVQAICDKCSTHVFMHSKRFKLEIAIFKDHGEKWKCKTCRKFDLRQVIKNYKKHFTNKNIDFYHKPY